MIDLNELETVLQNIKDNAEKYEGEISNLYNNIETLSSWKGHVRDNFLDLINSDMLSAKILISEIKSINDVIENIYNNYNAIGMKIEFNINKFDSMNTRIARIVSNLENIKEKYSSLDTSFCDSSIKSAINNSKKEVNNVAKKLTNSKNIIKKTSSKIKENERKISAAISKVEIKNINITEAQEYVTPKVVGSDGDYMLNTNDMEGLINSIQNSKSILEDSISEFENCYRIVIDSYNTKNTEKLNSLFNKVLEEMNKLEQIHENYVIGIEKYVNDIIEVNSKDFLEGVDLKNG